MEKIQIWLAGEKKTVYLHQEIDKAGGRWATNGPNSNTGLSLYADGRAYKDRYDARTNERISREYVGSWSRVEEKRVPFIVNGTRNLVTEGVKALEMLDPDAEVAEIRIYENMEIEAVCYDAGVFATFVWNGAKWVEK